MTVTGTSTLRDICFTVAEALKAHGIDAVLTGGSAATIYAPDVYTSLDADFVLDNEEPLSDVAEALGKIGFSRENSGHIFAHPNTKYTIDFPRGPLAVGGDYIREAAVLKMGAATLRILSRTDCIRDRLAHFYHWNDYTALNAAVGVAASNPIDVDMALLREWSIREQHFEKFAEFTRRLAEATDLDGSAYRTQP